MKKALIVFIVMFLVSTVLMAAPKESNLDVQRVSLFEKEIIHTPRHTTSRNVTILSEDFSGGTLPAGWQNVDNGTSGQIWEFDNPGNRSIYTTTASNGFVILDSDHYGSGSSQNADLITPEIDTTIYPQDETEAIMLEFEHYFRQYSTSAGTVSISTDRGTTWTVLETWTGTSTTNAITSSYDLTSYLTTRGTFMLKWNYVGSYAYYWAVDDIKVYVQQSAAPPSPATVVQPADASTDADINTSLIWADGGGDPEAYYLYFGTDNPPTNIVNGTDMYPETSYIPARLDLNQTYYWQVVPSNAYGNAAGCPVWSFTTYSPLPMPYSEGFEAGAPYTYILNNNGDDQNWMLYSGLPHDGTYAMGINTNTTSDADDWAFSPALDFTSGSLYQLACYYVAIDGDQELEVWWGTEQDPSNMTNELFNGTLPADPEYAYSAAVMDFMPIGAGPFYIGLHCTSTATDGTNTYLFIDDILVQQVTSAPDCPVLDSPISGVTGVSLTPTLEWTHANGAPLGYFLYVGTDNPPTNLINGATLGFVDSYTISSALDVEQTYYWYVLGYNSMGYSTGCTVESFVTIPDPTIYDFPYTEGFENGGSIPDGWSQEYVNGSNDWAFQAGGQSGHPAGAHDGDYNAFFYYGSGSTNYSTKLVTPPLDLSGLSNPILSFYHTQADWSGDQDILTVYYKTTEAGAWTQLVQFTDSITDWTLADNIGLPNTTSTYYIAFEGLQDYGYGVCLDDISIIDVLTGPDPTTLVSPTDAETGVSAATNLTWNASPGATGYKLSLWYMSGTRAVPTFVCEDADLGNVLTYDPSDDGVNYLEYNQTYSWQVTPYNNNGEATGVPTWTFTVENDPSVTTLPWMEGFENGGLIPNGWSQEYVTGTTNWTYQNGSSGYPANAYEGSYNARFYSTSDVTTMLVTPMIDFTGYTMAHLTFYHTQPLWSPDQDELTVYYKDSAGGSWVELVHYTESITTWRKESLDLPNLSSTYWLAFEGYATYGRGICLDNITVAESPAVPEETFITEVSDNATGQDASTGFIEITIQTNYTVDIGGWQVRVGNDDGFGNFTPTGYAYTIPANTTIDPDGCLIIGGGASYAAFIAAWGITDPINYISGDTQLGLTSGFAYDLYNPATRAGSVDSTPDVAVGEHVVQEVNDSWASGPADNATPGALDPGQTLPVTFAAFFAQPYQSKNVMLTWTTESESDMQGYHVYRSETSDLDSAVRLTSNIIVAHNSSSESNYEFEDSDIEYDITYYYWIESYENSGYTTFHGPAYTIVEEGSVTPPAVYDVTALSGNFPNPFNPETEIHFSIKGTEGEMVDASLVIYNIKGQRVKELFSQHQATERDKVVWHGTDDSGKPVASGVYFYRLKTADYSEIRKMMLLK